MDDEELPEEGEEEGGLFGQFADWAGHQVDSALDTVGEVAHGAYDLGGDMVEGAADHTGSFMNDVGDATGWQELSNFGNEVENAGDAIDQQWDQEGAQASASWDTAGDQAEATIGSVGDWADDRADAAIDGAVDTGVDLAAGAINFAQGAAQGFVGSVESTGDWLGNQVEGGLDTAGDVLSGGADLVGDVGGGLIGGLGGVLSGIGDATGLGGLSDLGQDVQDAGQQLDQGLDGLGQQANDSLDGFGSTADQALSDPFGLLDTDDDGSALDNVMGWAGSLVDDGLGFVSGGAIDTNLGELGEELGELGSDALGTRGEQTSAEADQAALDATIAGDGSQYQTIEARSEYYDSMHDNLHNIEGLKDIQFFGAASEVTNKFGVGVIEQASEDLLDLHSPETEALLMDVNTELFEGNMDVLQRAVRNGYPTDPLDPDSTEPISGMDFDLQMVKFEQGKVEERLDEYRENHTPEEYEKLRQEINADLNFEGPERQLGARSGLADVESINGARAALGLKEGEKLDFANQEHRMAIGRAKVFAAHNRGPEELAAYVQAQRPRVPDTD